MVKAYEQLPTTPYDPIKGGLKLATLEEVESRLAAAQKWGHSQEKTKVFQAWKATWPADATAQWETTKTFIPLHPWLWMYFKAQMRWRDALVNLGVSRKLFFSSTKHWSATYATHIETRRARDISLKSIGNEKGAGRKVVIPDEKVREMANSGLSVWQLHKLSGYSESAVATNLKELGFSPGMAAVFTKTKSLTYEDFLALERLVPGITSKAMRAKENPAEFMASAYTAWLNMSYLAYRFKKLMKVMREQYRGSVPDHVALTMSEAENSVARELIARGIPHARQVKLAYGEKFRVADFVVMGAVVVEVDDGSHNTESRKAVDIVQSALYEKLGLKVLRVKDTLARSKPGQVVDKALSLATKQ